jgi:FdhD protein
MVKPTLSQAHVPLVAESHATDAQGRVQVVHIPEERPLTIYVNRRELVTLMTLGAHAEWLVLGWLRNQRLALSLDEIHSIQVDWEVSSAAVVADEAVVARWETASQQRLVTTGCGQGAHHGPFLQEVVTEPLPHARISKAALIELIAQVRGLQTLYKQAGSVHGCGLFEGNELLLWVEDVGRHNAVDAMSGWMWMNEANGHDLIFYTTGRLTSEMVIKSALMDIPFLLSRSGVTRMGLDMARQVHMTLISRCVGEHFLIHHGQERVALDPQPFLETS